MDVSKKSRPKGSQTSRTSRSLLGADDAPPFTLVNPQGTARVFLVCDHAGCAVPKTLKKLGVRKDVFHDHMGHDMGAEDLTRNLSARLDAPAVVGT